MSVRTLQFSLTHGKWKRKWTTWCSVLRGRSYFHRPLPPNPPSLLCPPGLLLVQRCSYLLLWRRSELLGLLGREGRGHVERQHHLVVAEALVVLETGHEVVGEGHHRLNAVAHLAVTQVLQHVAHLCAHTHTRRVNDMLGWKRFVWSLSFHFHC